MVISLVAGFGVATLLGRFRGNQQQIIVKESSVLLERIEKVFKVVLAEGHFSEIYDYNDKKELIFGLKSGAKKALIVAKAKVLVGFDFAKVKIKRIEGKRQLVIEHLPDPEVLSIDSDYTIYDIDQGLFNKFNKDEYTKLLSDAKQTIHNKAVASELPKVANRQVHVLLNQLGESMGWSVEFALPAPMTPLLETKKEEGTTTQ